MLYARLGHATSLGASCIRLSEGGAGLLVALGPWGNSVQCHCSVCWNLYSRTFRYVTTFELIDTQKLNVVVFRNQILSWKSIWYHNKWCLNPGRRSLDPRIMASFGIIGMDFLIRRSQVSVLVCGEHHGVLNTSCYLCLWKH